MGMNALPTETLTTEQAAILATIRAQLAKQDRAFALYPTLNRKAA